jgi:hypothetical protein
MADLPPLPAGATKEPPMTGGVPPLPKGAEYKSHDEVRDTAEKKGPSFRERAADVLGTATGGGVAGFFAPEILTGAGMAASAFPLTAPAGPPLMMMGQGMRGARLASAGAGLVSGAGEEIAGQVAEKVAPRYEEPIRFAAGALTPEFAKTVGKSINYFLPVATKGTVKEAISDMARMIGTEEKALTPDQKSYLEKIVNDIRGGKVSDSPAQYSYNLLKQSTDNIVADYSRQAQALDKQAADILSGATQRTATLDKNLADGIAKLDKVAKDSAQSILNTAEAKANAIRERAKFSATNIRDILEIDAKQALRDGQAQAQKILSDAQQRTLKLRQQAGKQVTKTEQELTGAKQKLTGIGTPATETQTGQSLREAILPQYNSLKGVRDTNADRNFGDVFAYAKMLEQQGQTPSKTKAFGEFSKQVQDAMTDPVTGLANVPEGAIKQQLMSIANALKEKTTKEFRGEVIEIANQQLSFRGLETLRRVLRDRASGLPAEGADAISQDTAKKLAEGVESIQKEFSPGITKALEQYKADSAPLNEFKAKLGQAIVGKEDFDMGRFVTDPASVAKQAFSTETAIKDLIKFSGGRTEGIENIARNFVANKLKDADAKQIQSYLKSNNDWLNERTFPKLFSELSTAAQSLGRAEGFGGARSKLATALRTEAKGVTPAAQTAAQKAEEEALRLSQGYKTAGTKAVTGITEKAEKEAAGVTGDALKQAEDIASSAAKQADVTAKAVEKQKGKITTEAEKQAETLRKQKEPLTKQGEAIRNLIMGDATPARRMQEIILSGSPKLWEQVGPILTKDPQARKMASDAVRQVIADKAARSPAGAIDAWRKDVAPFVESSGLMSKPEVAALTKQIEDLSTRLDISPQQKLSNVQELVIRTMFRGVTSETARGLTSVFNPFNSLLGR